jgi:hypothetical protein
MDSLFIEAVVQIIEFLDYPDALAFTSTCREYRVLLYSQLVIDKYRQRMANIHKVCYGYEIDDHKFYHTGTNRRRYCGKCSCIVYKRRMNRHAKYRCNNDRPMELCEYNKPHTGICDCPYNKFKCYVCAKHIYSHQYVNHIVCHIRDSFVCICGAKSNGILYRAKILIIYCHNFHTNCSYRYQSDNCVMKCLFKKYPRRIQFV